MKKIVGATSMKSKFLYLLDDNDVLKLYFFHEKQLKKFRQEIDRRIEKYGKSKVSKVQ